MKTFREHITEKEGNSYESYKKSFNTTIEEINKIISYGRSLDMDNKLINPLLDAVKNIHLVDDAITKANDIEDAVEKPNKW